MWSIVSGVLGIAGFILSVVTAIYNFATKTRKVKICIKKYHVKHFDNHDTVAVLFRFDNLSHLNVSFSDVQLIIGDNCYNLDNQIHETMTSYRKNGSQIISSKSEYNVMLPVNLLPLSSAGGFLVFSIPPNALSDGDTTLTLKIWTSRGNPFQKTFVLGEDLICS